jgi:hypothetical protein
MIEVTLLSGNSEKIKSLRIGPLPKLLYAFYMRLLYILYMCWRCKIYIIFSHKLKKSDSCAEKLSGICDIVQEKIYVDLLWI